VAAKGVSVHIGLNRVDPQQYEGWSGDLLACEFDAKDMSALAKKQGMTPRTILTKKATADAVTSAIADAADTLKGGDLFLLSYSGHGGQVPDTNGDEPDDLDETWVLYDRQLVDDELYDLWSRFKEGVRILVLSDSCHSGSAIRDEPKMLRPSARPTAGFRAMPVQLRSKVYKAHKDEYDKIQARVPAGETAEIAAHVLLLSGCQDNQTSADGTRNGLFTQTLRQVWKSGKFKGSHRRFWKQISDNMPFFQSPNWFTVGEPNRAFERARPFTV
jgi:hypothetical protein